MELQRAPSRSLPARNTERAARSEYRPRRPEETVLFGIVAGHLETFIADAGRRDRVVPRFVERELRTFLDCGILAHGFLRVHCDVCGRDRLVPFSCKGRGFCPSCGGRRMADTAAHLVDRVLPEVPVRQWVLTLPFALRYRLAYDAKLTSEVLQLLVRAVFCSLRRRARRCGKMANPQCGAVTFVQRFGDALNLNVHFHTLALDGVYDPDDPRGIRFRPLPPPENGDVARVAARIARRLARLLERRGLAGDDDPAEHANVCVPARDRRRLERLCRYVARPPIATERLSQLPDGRLLYALKHRWRDGTTHVVFEPLELLEKLAALVPPPRFNLVRYHGILAPRATWRDAVVPASRADPSCETDDRPGATASPDEADTPATATASPAHRAKTRAPEPAGLQPSRYYTWGELMRRVFEIDVLECPHCGHGPMRILAAIHPPEATRAILEHLGLPSRAPPIAAPAIDAELFGEFRVDGAPDIPPVPVA
jgi:hypothetical protein